MKINVETNPITYKFLVNVVIQSIEKDGEEYLNKLMHHFSEYDFKIINGSYERKSISHDRLGNHNPHLWEVIMVKINLSRIVNNIHSPTDYIHNKLHNEIYEIFSKFNTNDNKLDYIKWVEKYWDTITDLN